MSDDRADHHPPSVLGVSTPALKKVAELARQVLREEGFSEGQIDSLLRRRYATEDKG
jgi:hypothetical protein